MPHILANKAEFDFIVVGASFAGSAFAQRAAAQGARVLALEKVPVIGQVVRTTGILITEVLELMDVPPRYLLDPVNTFRIYPPNRKHIEVSAPEARYWMTNTGGFLGWMASEAMASGAEIRSGVLFSGADITPSGVRVRYVSSGAVQTVEGRFLVGADGPRSHVARASGLHQNGKFLAGAEWIVEGNDLPKNTFNLIFDDVLAPGYCAWLAPKGDHAALGVAGYARRYNPSSSLERAAAEFSRLLGISSLRSVRRKGGLIPIDAAISKTYNERVLLLGDAAGICGAASGAGIFQAIASGYLAAEHLLAYLDGDARALSRYPHRLARFYRQGTYLFVERQIRRLLDTLGTSERIDWLFERFREPRYKELLRAGLLETRLHQMDRLFWRLVVGGILNPLGVHQLVSGIGWLARQAWSEKLPSNS